MDKELPVDESRTRSAPPCSRERGILFGYSTYFPRLEVEVAPGATRCASWLSIANLHLAGDSNKISYRLLTLVISAERAIVLNIEYSSVPQPDDSYRFDICGSFTCGRSRHGLFDYTAYVEDPVLS